MELKNFTSMKLDVSTTRAYQALKRRDFAKKAQDLDKLGSDEEKLQYIRQNTGPRTNQYKDFRQQL